MATVCGVTLIKQMTYRGDASEEWSNRYWFTGDIPANPTDWKALYDALIAQEKTLYLGTCAVVRAYGYDSDADDAVAVDSHDYLAAGATVAGTMTTGTGTYPAGDQAAWIRWKTSRLNTRGKPIFLRKYYHGVPTDEDSPSTSDNVSPSWSTAALAFGTKMFDGTFIDARTIRSQKHAETILVRGVSTFITTRTLHRRGKRPGS